MVTVSHSLTINQWWNIHLFFCVTRYSISVKKHRKICKISRTISHCYSKRATEGGKKCQRHITRSAKSSTTLSNDHARSLKPDAQDAHQPDLVSLPCMYPRNPCRRGAKTDCCWWPIRYSRKESYLIIGLLIDAIYSSAGEIWKLIYWIRNITGET